MEENSVLLKTPLLRQHEKLGAKMSPFGGWLMPIQYSGIIEEHNWTRKNAGLFDICHMGEFALRMDPEKGNLDTLVTISLKRMPLFSCRYGFMLDEKGRVIDDLIIYRIDREHWMIVVNAATTQGDFSYLRSRLEGAGSFEDISASMGKLDLQGPLSAEVLSVLAGPGIRKLKYYTFGYFDLLGERIIISRTGYTGELGYELYMPASKVALLWDRLLEDDRVKPVGLGARDTLRLEMCYSLYGQDINRNTTPVEAGLGNFIDWDKEFTGRQALLEEKNSGSGMRMIYFMAQSRRCPRHNYRIKYAGRDVGAVTSGSFSPSLGCGIGMGYADREIAPGETVALGDGSVSIDAEVTLKPFYKDGSAKSGEAK